MSRIDTIDMHMSIDPDKITGRDAADLIRIINGFLEEKQGELGAKNEEEKEEVKKKRDESDGNPEVPISGPYYLHFAPPYVLQCRGGWLNGDMTGIIPIHEMRGLIFCSHDEWPTLKGKIEQDFVAAFGGDENVLVALTIEVQ